jgi:transcription elongation GreA/GreB family factor
VRAFLAQELDRAVVFAPEQIAPDVVTMNSRALFRRDVNEGLECWTLVYDDAAMIRPFICVFTFAGAALLGLAGATGT